MKASFDIDKRFIFSIRLKIVVTVMMLIGVAALITGLAVRGADNYFWASILLNNYYVLAMALAGVFFIAVHNVSDSGWQTSIQRIPEAMGAFMPVAALLMLIFVVFGSHPVYHWLHPEYSDPIIDGKRPWLNTPFFIIRCVVYFAGWIAFAHYLRRFSLLSDQNSDLSLYRKQRIVSALFLIFFAITSTTSSWDWLMSIDVHWYSTLYGWYIFSGLLVSGIAMIILLIALLRVMGYLPHVNTEHLHDLGKYLFAFSIMWAYLWFSQYMLIWFSNIPEETIYFVQRLEHFNAFFFVNLILNFAVPFLALMTRNAKRIMPMLVFVSIVVLAGHWIDFYLAIMPGVTGEYIPVGIFDIGLTIGYLGLFLMITLRALSRAGLVPVNHPFFRESLEYHTNF